MSLLLCHLGTISTTYFKTWAIFKEELQWLQAGAVTQSCATGQGFLNPILTLHCCRKGMASAGMQWHHLWISYSLSALLRNAEPLHSLLLCTHNFYSVLRPTRQRSLFELLDARRLEKKISCASYLLSIDIYQLFLLQPVRTRVPCLCILLQNPSRHFTRPCLAVIL